MLTQADTLRAAIPALSAKDAQFAQSLLAGFDKYGKFTPKQAPWAEKLVERASKPKAGPKTAEIGDMAGSLYDALVAEPATPVALGPAYRKGEDISGALMKLQDFYLLDVRRHSPGHVWLVGAWEPWGGKYHDYIAGALTDPRRSGRR